jgi:hypothetical protein
MIEWLRRGDETRPGHAGLELAEFGYHLVASTIYRVLLRRGISRLWDMDVTGADVREPVVRYEHPGCGDLVHVDVKKLPHPGRWWVARTRLWHRWAPRLQTRPRWNPSPRRNLDDQ